MLPKESRLKAREDFERLFRKGRAIFLEEIAVLFAPGAKAVPRIGIAFKSKVFRRAASRHLYKRKMSEALRPKLQQLPGGIDIVILFQKKFPRETFVSFNEKAQMILESINKTMHKTL